MSELIESMILKVWVCILIFLLLSLKIQAQIESDEKPLIDITEGFTFEKDEQFKLNLRFRMQNRFGHQSTHGNPLSIEHFEARVRRMRLRMDGYLINKNLQYYIQLSFSRADQNLETGVIAQTVRDAILYYQPATWVYFGFGQSKLPGNRQRVTSSGNLQFADRSIANLQYNIDRDFGFFSYFNIPVKGTVWNIKTAITGGEGRNANNVNNGLAYTGRIEWLPFGEFEPNTDYLEGDYTFTLKPKLSLAVTYSFNHKAVLSGGQIGNPLPEPQNLYNFISDAVFKYKGFYLLAEYFNKRADYITYQDPENGLLKLVPAGTGYNSQVSFCFQNLYEPALRFAKVIPDEVSLMEVLPTSEIWMGCTKYLNGHRVKVQFNLIYTWKDQHWKPDETGNNYWGTFFQVEFGI